MRALAIGQSMSIMIGRRWRCLNARQRVALILLAASVYVGAALGYRWWTTWPVRAVFREAGEAWPLAFSPDGSLLATTGLRAPGITFRDVASGRPRATWAYPHPAERVASRGAFTPDGRTFVAVWAAHLPSETCVASIDLIDVASGRSRATIPARYGDAIDFAIADEGRALRLVTSDQGSGEVIDCDLATGRISSRRPFSVGVNWYQDALSPDGRLLALVPYVDGVGPSTDVILWDVDRSREVARLPGPPGAGAGVVAFDADARALGVGRDDGAIEIWDVGTSRLRATLRGHRSGFTSCGLRFAPDGSAVASVGCLDRWALSMTSLRWEVDRLRRVRRVLMDDRPFEVIELDIASGRCLGRADEEGCPVYSRDGRSLATTDGTVVKIRNVPARASR
jgi:WD40 repeat protein